MINLHTAIFALNPTIVTVRGDVAYDQNENVVEYNKSAAEVKLAELQAAETAKQEEKATAKTAALAKLTALGLTTADLTALGL
jgi:hypothetical protein